MTFDDAQQLEFRVLGPLEIRAGGRLLPLGGGKPRALLADLLIHRGQIVSTDRLIDDLWGAEPPASARHALEVHVSSVRKALGNHAAALVTRPPGYTIDVDRRSLDALGFEHLLEEARSAAEAAAALEALDAALALWRGPPLAEFTYEPFAQAEIARLEELRLQAVEDRIEAALALGRDAALIADLEVLVAENPLRERLCGQLMIALYRSGRQADALAAYRAARRTLVDELGVEAGPDLRLLEQAILRQDASLARPAPFEQRAVSTSQRKLVTILFVDLVDSTGIAQAVDAEVLQHVLGRYFDVAANVVARHGGTTEKFVGDALMAAFGTPLGHEDDALRAGRAALEIRDAVLALGAELEAELGIGLAVRGGIATGEVLAGRRATGDVLVSGRAVTLAARLQQAAPVGEIAVDETTRGLIAHAARLESLDDLSLRGIAEPVSAFRLVEVSPVAAAVARRLDAPLVGRRRELELLQSAFRRATGEPGLHVVALFGPAGIGKSRVARELVESVSDEATVLTGRCPPYGDGITYWPLLEVLGTQAAVLGAVAAEADGVAVAEQLTAALGGEGAGSADAIPWAFRRFCESVAATRPLVLVLDDLHWAEPPLRDLVEHLADRSSGRPILVVCLAREDLLEEQPGFLVGRANVERVVLEGLGEDEAQALADHLLAGTALPRATRERIAATAEGNPLFLEQLLAFASEGGAGVPPTVQALLAARLDRLGPGERAVLERAAVVGREFGLVEVIALLEPGAAPTAERHLQRLEERGFVLPTTNGFRFRHGLIQDAAYRSAPKAVRADLHERFADRLERRADASLLDELVGYHLEQAHRLHGELGGTNRRTRRLADDAGARLGAAGLRACKRNDASAATNLLGRATTLLAADDRFRRELLCELGIGLGATGETDRATETFGHALEAAVAADDRGIELRARVELAARRVLNDPEGAAPAFLDLAAEAIVTLDALGDDRALGRTWMLTGWIHGGVHCRNARWAEAADLARRHYRRAGWPSSACLGQLAAALYYGPTPVAAAIGCCEILLEEAEDLAGEANVRAFLAGLEAMRGRHDEALGLLARARAVFEELGQTSELGRLCGPLESAVHLLAGDAAAAELALRESTEIVNGLHDRSPLATQAAELAETLYRQSRIDEAEQWTHLAEKHAASDDVGAQFSWRAVRAKILARQGDLAAGEALAGDAVGLAEQTDALNQHAKVLLDLAEVVRLRGGAADAAAITAQAIELYERKENEPAAAAARTLLVATRA